MHTDTPDDAALDVAYHRPGEYYVTTHDWSAALPLTDTITSAVASVLDVDASTVEPFAAAVDPVALDTLFRPVDSQHARRPAGSVSFVYNGCLVTATSDGHVEIRVVAELDHVAAD